MACRSSIGRTLNRRTPSWAHLACLVATLTLIGTSVAADPIIKFGVAPAAAGDYGNLEQKFVASCGGTPNPVNHGFACGPAAAVNSFVFLQKTFPTIYGKKLVPEIDRTRPANDLNGDGNVDAYDDMIAAATELATATYMNTVVRRTTLRTEFYTGKRKYFEGDSTTPGKVPGKTTYSVMDDPVLERLDGGLAFPAGTPDLVRSPPNPEFFINALKKKQDVEILISQDNGTTLTSAHYLTVTGIEWDDTTRNDKFDRGEAATLHIVDSAPSSRGGVDVKQSRPLSQRADGRLFITMADNKDYDIRFAVEESAIVPDDDDDGDDLPEPGPLTLLGVAAAALGFKRRVSGSASRRWLTRKPSSLQPPD